MQPSIYRFLQPIALALVVAGLLVSGYLSYTKLTNTQVACVEGDTVNCDVVQNSDYATLAGIPIAYLGLGAYLFLGALLLLEKRVAFLAENGVYVIFVVALFGWLYSMWLVYVQAVILGAFCTWCLAHELIMTLFFIVAGLRAWQQWQTE